MPTSIAILASSRRLLFMGLLLIAVVLLFGAQTASAQPGVTWEAGAVCVADRYTGGGSPNCTANDVRITNITPALSDVCLFIGDTATAKFTLTITTTATTRYDIGMFIATQGGSALNGTACYHDFLQPAAATLNSPGTPLNPLGVGPFGNFDGDTCGDTTSSSSAFYQTQVEVSILCVDNNNDGIVDPVSTCTSWDNNANTTCNVVTQAAPGTPSKCACQTVPSGIKIYRGVDGGDLPDSYGTLFSSPNYPEGGARHAIQDPTDSGSPKTLGGQVAIWLGQHVDYDLNETNNGGFESLDALGDDNDQPLGFDDEDGVFFVGAWQGGLDGGRIDVYVNASGPGECTAGNDCTVAMWLDWDNSGDFDNSPFSSGGERYEFTLTSGANQMYTLFFDTPMVWNLDAPLAARVRLYDNSPGTPPYSPTGLVLNGEVEDYYVDLDPLAVTLSDFSAVCQEGMPLISWETVSEIDTQGFNLWRGASANGWDTQLNSTLIPAQNPGSTQSGSYQWLDITAQPDVEYFYWLQDLSLGGMSGSHGPVSVLCVSPTSVRLGHLDSNGPATTSLTWWAAALALAAVLGGLVTWQRRAKA